MTPTSWTAFRLTAQLSARLTRRRALASSATLLVSAVAVFAGTPTTFGWARHLPRFLATLSPGDRSAFLLVAWSALFLAIALAPVAGAAALEAGSGGLRRLTGYPAPRAALVAGLALGGLADVTLLPFAPPTLALGLLHGASGLVTALLLIGTAALTGQALLLAAHRLVTSRKVREAAGLVLPIAAAAFLIVATRTPARAASLPAKPTPIWKKIADSPLATLAPASPAGLASSSTPLAATVGLSVWVIGLTSVGAWLLGRPDSPPGESPRKASRPAFRPRTWWRGPADLFALVEKELVCLTREPFYRGGLGKAGATTAVVAFATLVPPEGVGDLFGLAGTGLLAWLGVWTSQLACNQLGGEFVAGAQLLLFPISRRRLIVGKTVAHGILLGGLTVGFTAVYALAARLPLALGMKFQGLAILWLLTMLGLGAIVSVSFPYPLFVRREAEPESPSLLLGLLHLVAAGGAAGIVATSPWIAPLVAGGSLWIASKLLERRDFTLRERLAN